MTTEADRSASARGVAAARAHIQADNVPEALAEARAAAKADPANTEAFAIWGVAAAELGDYIQALEPLTTAADRAPAGTPGWANLNSQLARTLSNVGFWAEAARRAFAVERLQPPDPQVRRRIGATFARIGLIERALPHLEWAVGTTPNWSEAQLDLGVAYLSLGRLEEAEQALERAVSLSPLWVQPHMALAPLRRWTPATAHIERLEAVRAHPGISAFDRACLGFSLFKELNDVGRYGEAWPVLEAANEAIRDAEGPWSAEDDRALIDALIETFPAERFQQPAAPPPSEGTTPIFIVGLPRSGTTLVERIIASHSQVTAMGEVPSFPILFRGASSAADRRPLNAAVVRGAAAADWSRTAKAYRAETAFLTGVAAFATDKLPANSLLVGAIRLAFPDAAIVYVRRDPMDIFYSAYRVQFAGLYGWSHRLADMAEHYANHRRLMAHWRSSLGDGLTLVDYEDLVADPETEIRRLIAACGLPFEAACLTPHETAGAVRTASIVQVRQPITAAGIGAWRRYEAQMEPLRARLGALDLLDSRSS